jgi:predicted metalloprotease with PDZ domain
MEKRKWITLLLLVSALLMESCAHPHPSNAISFSNKHVGQIVLGPDIVNGTVRGLLVQMQFQGNPKGTTTLLLPNEWGGQSELWRGISDFRVKGGTFDASNPAEIVIDHPPSGNVTVFYMIKVNQLTQPSLQEVANENFRPLVGPTWFSAVGATIFAQPVLDKEPYFQFSWSNIPDGWKIASDLEDQKFGVNEMMSSVVIGGVDLTLLESDDQLTKMAIIGEFQDASIVDIWSRYLRVAQAQKDLWGGQSSPFLVTLVALQTDDGTKFQLGTGLGPDAFATWAAKNTSLQEFEWLFAHENFHRWLPVAVGGLGDPATEVESYWFSEGFADFYAARTLLRSGVWTPRDWIEHWNKVISDYDASSARLMPSDVAATKFWTDPEAAKLPYRRGALLAMEINQQIRIVSNGRTTLDDIMLALRDAAEKKNGEVPAQQNIIEIVKEQAKLNLGATITEIATQGEAIEFPYNGWDGCLLVKPTVKPRFDVGYDLELTAKTGIANGVKTIGPAYAAGLRDGMKMIRRTGGVLGDVNQELIWEVETDLGSKKTLRWLPRGESVTTQEITLGPSMLPTSPRLEVDKCLLNLAGQK